jgi:uncharacterized membrane protein
MKPKIIAAVLVIVSTVLFYFVFTEGLMYVYDFLGLYNVPTFRFILGEAVAVALVLLICFLPPLVYLLVRRRKKHDFDDFTKSIQAQKTPGKRLLSVICSSVCGFLGIIVIILLHTGFFKVISKFLLFSGFAGPVVNCGMFIFEFICAVFVLSPSILAAARFLKKGAAKR